MLVYKSGIDRILGTTKHVCAKNSKEFGREISKYIDSKDQKRGNDKDKGKKKDDKKAAPKPSGNPLMDLITKKANAQASVFKGGPNANGNTNGNGNANAGPSNAKQGEDNIDDLELWPLIKSVKVQCDAAALSTGS